MSVDPSHLLLDKAEELGHLWLRLLACTPRIEEEIRRRLRERFHMPLPRFACLARLHRKPEGLMMKERTRTRMGTGGNGTGLIDELERECLRAPSLADRFAWLVGLTDTGPPSDPAPVAGDRRPAIGRSSHGQSQVEAPLATITDTQRVRRRGADLRSAGRRERAAGRASVPRDPRAAHGRGRYQGPARDPRAETAQETDE